MTNATRLASYRPWLCAALALFAGGCLFSSQPVRVVPRNEADLHQDLDVCALHGDVPSAWTSWFLRLAEQEDEFRAHPTASLKALHERVAEEPTRNMLFAMAELSYLAGKRTLDRDCFLAAAVYAYLYLLEDVPPAPPSAYDRRFRWACDIYDRSLVRAFKEPKQTGLRLEAGLRELPMGSLQVEVDTSSFPFETEGLELLPADELEVRGLGFRVRDSGLGAPLIAIVRRREEGTAGVGIQDKTSVSATAFLRVEGGVRDLASGVRAELELHSTSDAVLVDVDGRDVPLEADLSATIAYGTQSADLWSFDLRGLFQGRDAARQNGLILPRPYEPGRIPVVLVHGTASSPSYWAELINSLNADPVLRAHVQFWLFIYSTGNPIAYSAATLRESLRAMVARVDPAGKDEALKHMVVVGHSQGGLLARWLGIHVDVDEAMRKVLGKSVADLHLDAQALALLRRCFDVEPMDCVDRLVFVCTPHRGSFLASSWFSRFFAKLIAVPGDFVGLSNAIVRGVPEERLPPGLSTRVPTSLDNMNPASPVLRYLADKPIDPRIHVHSIIAIGSASEPEGADDGVVAYESAHLVGAESEVLVPSGHSCQAHPRTIIELRRILREHLETLAAQPAQASSKP